MWRILGNLLSTFATWTYSHPFWTLYRFRSNNRLKKLEDALVKTSATTRWHCLHLGSPQKERVNKKQKYFASIISAFILHLLEKIRYVTGTQPSTSQTLPPLSSSIPVMPSPLTITSPSQKPLLVKYFLSQGRDGAQLHCCNWLHRFQWGSLLGKNY